MAYLVLALSILQSIIKTAQQLSVLIPYCEVEEAATCFYVFLLSSTLSPFYTAKKLGKQNSKIQLIVFCVLYSVVSILFRSLYHGEMPK